MQKSKIKNQKNKGATLIEVIMAMGIFSLVSASLFILMQMGIKIVRDNQSRLDALSIAQSQMEILRNLPYDKVGTVGGIPTGPMASKQTVTRNKVDFTVKTSIQYVDDSYDDTAPNDLINTDYKKIRIKVDWVGQYIKEPIILITNIAQEGIETSAGGGTLWIEVYNTSSEPIKNANVNITNLLLSPSVDISETTDEDGKFILPGALPAVQSYHIEINKSGYSAEQTYVVDAINNPNPDPADQTVLEREVTTKFFYIDKVSMIKIHIADLSTRVAVPNIPLTLISTKKIGTNLNGDPIPKFSAQFSSNSTGDITINSMEYDTYSLELNDIAVGLDVAGISPRLPFVIPPDTEYLVNILTTPDATSTLLVSVESANLTPIIGASVRLFDSIGSFDTTLTASEYGQTFFTPAPQGNYNLDVSATNYQTLQTTLEIVNDTQFVAQLLPI